MSTTGAKLSALCRICEYKCSKEDCALWVMRRKLSGLQLRNALEAVGRRQLACSTTGVSHKGQFACLAAATDRFASDWKAAKRFVGSKLGIKRAKSLLVNQSFVDYLNDPHHSMPDVCPSGPLRIFISDPPPSQQQQVPSQSGGQSQQQPSPQSGLSQQQQLPPHSGGQSQHRAPQPLSGQQLPSQSSGPSHQQQLQSGQQPVPLLLHMSSERAEALSLWCVTFGIDHIVHRADNTICRGYVSGEYFFM